MILKVFNQICPYAECLSITYTLEEGPTPWIITPVEVSPNDRRPVTGGRSSRW